MLVRRICKAHLQGPPAHAYARTEHMVSYFASHWPFSRPSCLTVPWHLVVFLSIKRIRISLLSSSNPLLSLVSASLLHLGLSVPAALQHSSVTFVICTFVCLCVSCSVLSCVRQQFSSSMCLLSSHQDHFIVCLVIVVSFVVLISSLSLLVEPIILFSALLCSFVFQCSLSLIGSVIGLYPLFISNRFFISNSFQLVCFFLYF